MSHADQLIRLLQDELELKKQVRRTLGNPSPSSPTLVANTKTITHYPSAPGQYFACEPMSVLGVEAEGEIGTFTNFGAIFFALNLGTAIPPSGTKLIVTFVENRWVFRYDG